MCSTIDLLTKMLSNYQNIKHMNIGSMYVNFFFRIELNKQQVLENGIQFCSIFIH